MTRRGEAGQATVELVALLPLVVAVVAAVMTVIAVGTARQAAAAAAHAGALAALQERDPARAARAALRGWPPSSWDVRLRGRRVTVEVRPRLAVGALAARLAATAVADAGPEGDADPSPPRGGDGRSGSSRGRVRP